MMAAVTPVTYTTLLLDLDHTLLDSNTSEALAFEQALRSVGVDAPNAHFPAYDRINRALWSAVERGEIRPGQVRTARFEQLIAEAAIEADPGVLADAFVAGLGMYGELYPGAREVLETLAGRATLAMLTNGLSDVQRTRIERLDLARYFDAVVISAEVGASKPSGAIYDIAFEQLGMPQKGEVLMVGDSLTSDIRGGTDYGIATCWYNHHHIVAGCTDRFDHEIDDLALLPGIVLGGR
jgi:2-haloacid dehalogenase